MQQIGQQENDPYTVTLKRGESITLKKSGSGILVLAGVGGIEDTGIKLSRADTLTIKGDGSRGVAVDHNVNFAPRIAIQTDRPLEIHGSFIAAASSTQIAQVAVTPVELTAIKFGYSAKGGGKSRDPETRKYIYTPSYKLSTTGRNLKQSGGSSKPKTLEYKQDGEKYKVAVENGARIDFINTEDADEALFSLDGGEPMAMSVMRFKRTRNAAMNQVAAVLNINEGTAGSFDRAKERAGVPDELQKGRVKVKGIGRVDMDVSPVIEGSGGAPIDAKEVDAKKTVADNKIRTDLIKRVEDYLGVPDSTGNIPKEDRGHTYNMLRGSGKLPKWLGSGESNMGVELGAAMLDVRVLAGDLYNERTEKVRSNELALLHRKLEKVNTLSEDLLTELKQHDAMSEYADSPEKAKNVQAMQNWVIGRTEAIQKDFSEFHNRLNKSKGLGDNRVKSLRIDLPVEPSGKDKQPEEQAQLAPAQSSFEESVREDEKTRMLERLARQAMTGGGGAALAVADVAEGADVAAPSSLPAPTTGGNTDKKGNRAA